MGRLAKFEYVIYKGDEVVCHGTRKECADMLGVKEDTITYLSCKQSRDHALKYPDSHRMVAEKVSIAEIEKELAI
ncbi:MULTISPECIES: hypothetical protein [Staphylococcus]|uniref:Uncharacterized protein n=1 Tax=Staphylococcus equorum TaxID=246432 RepID=A0A9X4L880_9STAP|nr:MULTISPECIES: hypothetical protein [Staphylococcus]KRG09873.1 phage protein [Staphylococcus sp. NAM3COL9]MDG0843386.1 hypothetical protein [Staphylococcus equorum]MDG0858697.1 hypothetical protein [Staphylococcus equorum]